MTVRRNITAGLLMASALAAAGCAQEQESLIVSHVPAWSDGECVVDANESAILLQGTLDLSFGTGYAMPVILENQLLSQVAVMSNSGVDDGELQLIGADVVLRMPQDSRVIDQVERAADGLVDFSVDLESVSLASSGAVGVLVEVVSQRASEELAIAVGTRFGETGQPTLLADTTFRARRTGNRVGKVGEIESRKFTYPIKLCFGCLFSARGCPDMMPPQNDSGQIVGGVCGNAQDFFVGPSVCSDPNE